MKKVIQIFLANLLILSGPNRGLTQNGEILFQRAKATGIAAVFKCMNNAHDRKDLSKALKKESLSQHIDWLESTNGAEAINLFANLLNESCLLPSEFTQRDQELLGNELLPFLKDKKDSEVRNRINHQKYSSKELDLMFEEAKHQYMSGNNASSISIYLQALEIAERTQADPRKLVIIHMGLGLAQQKNGDLTKAIKSFEKAEIILLNSRINTDSATNLLIISHAEAIYQSGQHKKGQQKLEKWIIGLEKENAMLELTDMKIHAYKSLGYIYIQSKKKEQAREILKKMIFLVKQHRGETDQSLILPLRMIAITHSGDGFTSFHGLTKQEELYQKVVEICIKNKNNAELAIAYKNLGVTKIGLKKFKEAEFMLLEALDMTAKLNDKKGEEYLHQLETLQSLYDHSKDLGKKLSVSLEIKNLTEQIYGLQSEEHIRTLISLANTYNSIGQHEKAYNTVYDSYKKIITGDNKSALLIHSLELTLRNSGKWKTENEDSIANTTEISPSFIINAKELTYEETVRAGSIVLRLWRNNKPDEARKVQEKLIQNFERHLGKNHANVMDAKVTSAVIISQTNPIKAIKELLELEDRFNNLFITDHLAIAEFYKSLAMAYWSNNQRAEEDIPVKKSVESTLKYLTEVAPTLSDRQRLRMSTTYSLPLIMAYTGASERKTRAEIAYFTHINRQGLLAEIEKTNQKAVRKNQSLRALGDTVSLIDQKLSRPDLSKEQLDSLYMEKETIQLRLNNIIEDTKIPLLNKEKLAKRLGKQSVLIEFQKYWRFEFLEKDEGEFYQAYILSPDSTLEVIQLGSAKRIDQQIWSLRKALESQDPIAEEEAEKLSKTLLAPLKNINAFKKKTFITLDGEMHSIPASLLLTSLKTKPHIRLLSASRDLIRTAPQSQSQTKVNPSVVVSNPSFDIATEKPKIGQEITYASNLRGWSDTIKNWEPLPGTKKEGEEVHELLNGRLITKEEATTDNILRLLSPKILHIATHAFYFPAEKVANILDGPEENSSDNPLIRSGIVLAGANKMSQNDDDGILTSLEISSIDLSNTKLVTLSACETGLGDSISGEGLFGLQRALSVAGAQNMLLSLWKVDDTATASFMAYFYTGINQGLSLIDSLDSTQTYFKNHPIPAWRHPYYWAAFQLYGY